MRHLLKVVATATIIFTSCTEANIKEQVKVEPSADFIATFNVATRTVLEGTAVVWSDDDQLSIFTKTAHNRRYNIKAMDEGGRNATFGFVDYSGDDNTTIDANYAVYPYNADAELNGDVITTTLNAQQVYNAENCDLSSALMAAKSSNNNFVFENTCALLRFNLSKSPILSETYTLTSIQISSDSINLAGEVTIDTSTDCKAIVASSGDNRIMLTGIDEEVTTDVKSFYIVAPAVDFAENELKVEFIFGDLVKKFALPAFNLKQGTIKTITYQIDDYDDFTGSTPSIGEDEEGEDEGEDEIQSGDGILPTFESNEIVGNNVPFAVGDKFYVFNKINNCDEYKYNGNTNEGGKPIIELSNPTYYSSHEEIDKVIIVYNSENLQSSSLPVNEGSATSVNAVVKSVQDYVRGSYDIHAAPMISVSDDLGSVLLKNVCGWVKVSLTGNGETVKKIEFSGNNNENLATSTMLYSAATVSLADLSITNIGYAYNKLTMRFGEESDDVATLSSTPTDFYFSMLPTEFTNGFNMKITCTDGTMMTYTTNNSISVSRNEVYQETPFAYAGEQIKISLSDLNTPLFRDLTYTEGYANTFEVKVANSKYQNGFFIFYNPDYQPSGTGDAGTLNGEYEIVTDEIGTKTYTAKTFIADPSRSCVPYDGDLYYFKSGKVTVSGNNASTTIAFDAIVTNSEGSELPLKSQCTLESMGYTTLTNAENLGFSSFVYQASGGYFTMQSTSGQNTMTIELKTTAKTPNELKDKTFTDTALTDYISSGSLQMGDLTSYDTLVGSITFTAEGLNYTMTTKGLKFIDYTGNIYQIPDGGYSISLTQGTINSGGGFW